MMSDVEAKESSHQESLLRVTPCELDETEVINR